MSPNLADPDLPRLLARKTFVEFMAFAARHRTRPTYFGIVGNLIPTNKKEPR